LENLFKRTTDITLLELTDYNHPLLHQMQLAAPGTYHHSLVVAQLAENAAAMIKANPLLGRVCALFHDIGKTAQPEYFTENHREGATPHDKISPVESAAIIKAHVERGVALAQQYRLPRAIIDVIQQHHGTTIIQSFYRKACKLTAPNSVSLEGYRYAGPKPQFKESAIISLADTIEAATRSLRTVTAAHLGELLDRLFQERLAEGQLDEAPLTLEELAKIKTSFTFTLLNMLHSRVAYAAPELATSVHSDPEAPSASPASHG
jgi:cyclic-di-AMP phosphodiesterase PgpH